MQDFLQIIAVLLVALVWMYVNIRTRTTWVKLFSLMGLMFFLVLASGMVVSYVGLI